MSSAMQTYSGAFVEPRAWGAPLEVEIDPWPPERAAREFLASPARHQEAHG